MDHYSLCSWLIVELAEMLVEVNVACLDIATAIGEVEVAMDDCTCIIVSRSAGACISVIAVVDVVLLLQGSGKLECDSGEEITLRDLLRFLLLIFSPALLRILPNSTGLHPGWY